MEMERWKMGAGGDGNNRVLKMLIAVKVLGMQLFIWNNFSI